MSIVSPNSIYYRVHEPETPANSKAPAILLHGLMGFAANWGKIWPKLNDRPVLVLDQRGHGRSTHAPLGEYSPQNYAEDLNALMKSLSWDRAHIVGHSMGGRVALYFADLFPQKTASLVLEDSGMEANPSRVLWIERLLAKIPTPFPNRESAKEFFEREFQEDPMTGSFLNANLEEKRGSSLDWRFFAPAMIETVQKGRALDAMPIFKKLSTPTLIIRGSKSHELPAEEAQRMEGCRDNIELVTIEGAGHYVHAEKPQEFSNALNTFFNRVEE